MSGRARRRTKAIGLAGLGAVLLGLLIGILGVLSGGSAAGADTRAHADYSVVNSMPDTTAPSHGLFDGAGLDLRPMVFAGALLIAVGGLVLMLRQRQLAPADDAGTGRALFGQRRHR